MTDARDANGGLLPDAVRLTRFGRFLRSSYLDELPELWNVLRGEMRLVLSVLARFWLFAAVVPPGPGSGTSIPCASGSGYCWLSWPDPDGRRVGRLPAHSHWGDACDLLVR